MSLPPIPITPNMPPPGLLLQSAAPSQTLPHTINGSSEGSGWQVATDPHAQPSDGTGAQSTLLASGQGVFVTREKSTDYDGIVVTTTNADDAVTVKQRPDGTQDVTVNGQTTNIRLAPHQQLEIRTEGGNDRVNVDGADSANVTVYGGDGNDTLTAGGTGSIDTGAAAGSRGNQLQLVGEGGNDTISAASLTDGAGKSAAVFALGGDGNDRISALGGNAYVRGGEGDDTIGVYGDQATVSGDSGDPGRVPQNDTDNDTINTRGNGVVVGTDHGKDTVNVRDGSATVHGQFDFFSVLFGDGTAVHADPGASVDKKDY